MPCPPDAIELAPQPFAPSGFAPAGDELPLQGLTVLAVEDSRFACDALRLMCRRSGARLRRAETLEAARAHLRVYRPDIVLVDLGLPDGRGEALIQDLAAAPPGRPAILGMSGDPAGEALALAAGADAFLDKPVAGIATFQSTLRATLPGAASLFLDGVFVGRAALPLLRAGEEISLAFGADDRIRVAYEPQARRRAQEGSLLTGRTSTEQFEALITLRSFHARPIEVTVQDQLPVSSDADLTVAMQADPAPSARDVDDRPGVVAWTLTLAPQQERRIRFGFTVTAPRERQVQGLPGR